MLDHGTCLGGDIVDGVGHRLQSLFTFTHGDDKFVDDALGPLGFLVRMNGQLSDFLSDHGEPFAFFTSPGCFHRGVQRQDVGCKGNILDGFGNGRGFLGTAGCSHDDVNHFCAGLRGCR